MSLDSRVPKELIDFGRKALLAEAQRYANHIATLTYGCYIEFSANAEIPALGFRAQSEETLKMLKVKTVHFIDGRNIADMSQDDMIGCIADAENDISNLEALSTKSKAVTKKIDSLKAGIEAAVVHLDKKAG